MSLRAVTKTARAESSLGGSKAILLLLLLLMCAFKQELAMFGVKQKIVILSSVNEGERPFKGTSATCHFLTPVSNLIDIQNRPGCSLA